jgi:SSS family solute:Na+ symporter
MGFSLFSAADAAANVTNLMPSGIAWLDVIVFFGFIITVVAIGMWMSRHEGDSESYFLAGRGLTWWLIGFSLIAANISTEQFVGMSGDAARDVGLAIAGFEWLAAITLVVVAFFFLPKFLRVGIYTIPEFLEQRYSQNARLIMSLFMVLILVLVTMAGVVYSGAKLMDELIDHPWVNLYSASWMIGVVAAGYVMFGGLKACAWADLLQGSALIIGGAIVLFLAMNQLSNVADEDPRQLAQSEEMVEELEGKGTIETFTTLNRDRLSAIRPAHDNSVPWTALIFGLWIPNFYYWGLNQYIMQRTLGANSLAEGQKGIVFAAGMKLIIPFIVVFPGIIAFNLYHDNMRETAFEKENKETLALFETTAGISTGLLEDHPEVFEELETPVKKPLFRFQSDFAELYPGLTREIMQYNEQQTKLEIDYQKNEKNRMGEPLPPDESLEKKNEELVARIQKNPELKEQFVSQKALMGYDEDSAYPLLIENLVPEGGLKGFMMAAIMGAVLSSLASMLNAASTIFTMDLAKRHIFPDISEFTTVTIGRICVILFAVVGCVIAPFLSHPAFGGLFSYIQEFQGFISPGILAIFLFGFFVRKAPAVCGVFGLVASPVVYAILKFSPWMVVFLVVDILKIPVENQPELLMKYSEWFAGMAYLDRMAITFTIIMICLAAITLIKPRKEKFEFEVQTKLDMTSSSGAKIVGVVVVLLTLALYYIFRGPLVPF